MQPASWPVIDKEVMLEPNGNSTTPTTPIPTTVPLGLAVGLPLSLLLLAAAVTAAALLYVRRCKSRRVTSVEEGQKAGDAAQYTSSPRYMAPSTVPPHTAQHSPIYENFREGSGSSENGAKGPPQDEDLYLECDPQDEAIYSNDPSQPGYSTYFGSAEDEYVAPDVL